MNYEGVEPPNSHLKGNRLNDFISGATLRAPRERSSSSLMVIPSFLCRGRKGRVRVGGEKAYQ